MLRRRRWPGLARFYVDDKTAAEDLVQEAFIRFARHHGRLRDGARAAAYLRSIVINPALSPDGGWLHSGDAGR